MHEPRLIYTGGTLSAERNASGMLVPSGRLDKIAQNAGFNTATALHPYTIDSIDFDLGLDTRLLHDMETLKIEKGAIDSHFALLRNNILTVLNEKDIPVVAGGSDSKYCYPPAVVKDLMRRGHLQPGSKEKIIFVSSMKDLQKDPNHIEKIFKAARVLADQSLTGGLALSAENDEGTSFAIHDVLNHFDKISATLTNAFRSAAPLGYIRNGKYEPNPAYHAPEISEAYHPLRQVSGPHDYARIAPPLVRNQSSAAILAFMDAMDKTQPPLDGLLIEGLPSGKLLHKDDEEKLAEYVRYFKDRDIRVVFCNPLRYENDVLTSLHNGEWNATTGLAKKLSDAGAEFATGLPKDIWLDMVLTTPVQPHAASHAPKIQSRIQPTLTIRYMPDSTLMRDSIHALAPITHKLQFSAMSHGSMPESVLSALKDNAEIGYRPFFEYDGKHYREAGKTVVEGASENPYAAASAATRFFQSMVRNGHASTIGKS